MARRHELSDHLPLDEIAALTDEEIVRRRFDSGNIRFIGALSTLTFLIALIQLIGSIVGPRRTPHMLPVAAVHFVVAATAAAFFGELAYAQRRRGSWKPRLPIHAVARNLTPWVQAFLITELTLLVFYRSPTGTQWLAWLTVSPWVVIPVRLEISRRIALHISFLAAGVLSALILGAGRSSPVSQAVAITAGSAIALLIGAATSRRLRLQTLEEWGARRASAREQVRMRDELEYAREIQLSMLPESAPVTEWLDIAGISVPATEVGGDYFDYFADSDAITIVCGDVAGHGLGSGIVLASLRSGFTLLRDALHDPSAVLQRLNDLVAQTSRRRMLATVAVVRLDRTTRSATIASAGHPPVIVRRGGAIETIELFAPPLGVRLPYTVPSRSLSFTSGDVFVLHSDGIYESQNPAGESYGLDRLAALLSGVAAQSAAEIRDAITRDVEAFRGTAAQTDDVTVVVARVA